MKNPLAIGILLTTLLLAGCLLPMKNPWEGIWTGSPGNITVDYGTGINALKFRPLSAFQHGVAPVNQTSLISLYVVSNELNYTRNLTMNMSVMITGFSPYCSEYANKQNPLRLNTTAQYIAQIPPLLSGNTSCLQPDAQASTSCGAIAGGSYNDNGSSWHDNDWSTYVTMTPETNYSATYVVSSKATNSTILLGYGNSSVATNVSIDTFSCSNNSTSMTMNYIIRQISNGSDGSVNFTTTTKTFGNLVNNTDYRVVGDTLYLNTNRLYNFVSFRMGSGTTLTTNNTTGIIVAIAAQDEINLTGVNVSLTGITIPGDRTASFSFVNNTIYGGGTGAGGSGGDATGGVSYGGAGGAAGSGFGGGGGGGGASNLGVGGAGGTGGYPNGSGGAAINLTGPSQYSNGNPGGASAGGGGAVSIGVGDGNTFVSGKGGDAYGSAGSASGDGGAQCVGGGGGAGGSAGKYGLSILLAAKKVFLNSTFDLRGTDGTSGASGASGSGYCGGVSVAKNGGGGGGGGGGNAGKVYAYYWTSYQNASTYILTGGSLGAAGSGGTAGQNGQAGNVNITSAIQPGLHIRCPKATGDLGISVIDDAVNATRLYEAQANWTLTDQPGTKNIWCWADFNGPSPRSQSFNFTINGVDP